MINKIKPQRYFNLILKIQTKLQGHSNLPNNSAGDRLTAILHAPASTSINNCIHETKELEKLNEL